MTVGPRSQCQACVHFTVRQSFSDPFTCNAFPAGIPDAVRHNQIDHRQPVEGDHGIQFEAKAGDEFPAYAIH